MKTAVVTLSLLIFSSVPALSQTPLQRHEAEARAFLGHCDQTDDVQRQECLGHQQHFIELYVRGLAGDFTSIWATAGSFKQQSSGYYGKIWSVAVPPRPVEACAWSYLAAYLAKHQSIWENEMTAQCGSLSQQQSEAVKHTLRGISNAAPFKVPTTWRPSIPNLVASSQPPREEPYVPPKGAGVIDTVPDDPPGHP